MTRAFTTARRRISPSALRRQALPARGQTSEHAGSKPGYLHLSDMAPAARFEAAQAWAASTGRPLPPHMRPRQPLRPAAPLDVTRRHQRYAPPPYAETSTAAILADPRLSPAQRKRLRGKAGTHGEIPAGMPSPRQARPSRPRTPAQRARAKRNFAQQARHLAKARS